MDLTNTCILNYHAFLSSNTAQHDPLYIVSDKSLYRQLIYLKDKNFNFISPREFISYKYTSCSNIIITIDDGDHSIYSVAMSIFHKLGLTATLFIVTDKVGETGFLTWNEIIKLHKEGFLIQSHTHTHSFLSELSRREIKKELAISKTILEEKVGNSVEGLSLPGGSGNIKLVGSIAGELGYKYVVTSEWGLNKSNADPFCLKRIPVKSNQTMDTFKGLVEGNPEILRKIKRKKFALKILKMVLGFRVYTRVRNLIK